MSQKDSLFPQLQETIAQTCLTYMLFNDLDVKRKKGDNWPVARLPVEARWAWHAKYPFFCYSLKHWGYHASKLPVREIIEFLDSACCGKVVKIFHTGIRFTDMPVPLHFAVQYNLLDITKVLLDRGDDPCQCKTPLLITAIKHKNLDQNEIDLFSWNSGEHWTPSLSYAVQERSTQIVEMLL